MVQRKIESAPEREVSEGEREVIQWMIELPVQCEVGESGWKVGESGWKAGESGWKVSERGGWRLGERGRWKLGERGGWKVGESGWKVVMQRFVERPRNLEVSERGGKGKGKGKESFFLWG